jgi:hypothetical protein
MRALATLREVDLTAAGNRKDEPRIIQPLPEAVIEHLAELWCEALLANLQRHPLTTGPS